MKAHGKECPICAVTYRGKAINKVILLMFVPVMVSLAPLPPVHPVAWSDLVTCADAIQFQGLQFQAVNPCRSDRRPCPKVFKFPLRIRTDSPQKTGRKSLSDFLKSEKSAETWSPCAIFQIWGRVFHRICAYAMTPHPAIRPIII